MNVLAWAVISLVVLGACRKGVGKEGASSRFTEQQLRSQFAYDLGPDSIDVSSYPGEGRRGYKFFSTRCSQCHTLARPINAPHIRREDWKRYVDRMHVRARSRGKDYQFSWEEGRAIIDFLSYDARVRKVQRRKEFAELQKRLENLFREVRQERARIVNVRDREKARPYVYMGE
ncbi:MAG: hypothetical protein HY402_05310 [Elusimicrobia bacterium]|nr:hypothetical protein [Elusimicrobiota bacterium]